jgi:hypothetical protein
MGAGNVVRRLSGIKVETSAVYNLTTQFGGGKTHAMTLLYHLASGLKVGGRSCGEEWSRSPAPWRSTFASPLIHTALGIDAGVTKNKDIRSDTHSHNNMGYTRCS